MEGGSAILSAGDDNADGDRHLALPSFAPSASAVSRPTSQDDIRALYYEDDALLLGEALDLERPSAAGHLLEPHAMRHHDAKQDLLAAGLPSNDRLVSWDQRQRAQDPAPAGYDVFESVLNGSSYFKSLAEHRKYRLQQRALLEQEFESKARSAVVSQRAAVAGSSTSAGSFITTSDPAQLQQSFASARGLGIPEAPLIKRLTARAHVSFISKRDRGTASQTRRRPDTGIYLDSISSSVPYPHATRLMIQKQQQRDQRQDQRRRHRKRQQEKALFEW